MINTVETVFNAIDGYLKKTVWNNIPNNQIIYHYTNSDSLISIVKDQSFWLSSIELMNDKIEVDYSISIVTKTVNGINFPDNIKNELINNFKKSKKTSAINTFALSFSLDKDSLNLWNNYSKYDGYNLGFQLSTILDLLEENIHILDGDNIILVNGKVIYNEDIQIGLLDILFRKYYELYLLKKNEGLTKPEDDKDVSSIWKMIHLYSSMIKSNHHNIENEYRLILHFLIIQVL